MTHPDDPNSIFDLADEMLRGMSRRSPVFQNLAEVVSAYKVAADLKPDTKANSELYELVDRAGRLAWDATVLGASIGLRLAGSPGDSLDRALRGGSSSERDGGSPHVIDMGDLHLASGSSDGTAAIDVPIRVVNRSFYEEGSINFTCSDFIGPGPPNLPVSEVRLPAYVSFNPQHVPKVTAKQDLATIMTVRVSNKASRGEYKALVQALPLNSWVVVSLRVR